MNPRMKTRIKQKQDDAPEKTLMPRTSRTQGSQRTLSAATYLKADCAIWILVFVDKANDQPRPADAGMAAVCLPESLASRNGAKHGHAYHRVFQLVSPDGVWEGAEQQLAHHHYRREPMNEYCQHCRYRSHRMTTPNCPIPWLSEDLGGMALNRMLQQSNKQHTVIVPRYCKFVDV
jgi:hypothetical protein